VKIFISWSGEHAKLIARALHAWLGDIFDSASPWMSDIDIAGGQRGLNEIERSLADAGFGVIVTTRDNHGAPWLNYEAGALGNQLETDSERRVVPVLVNVRLSEIKGPIGQFQSVRLERDGIADLVKSMGQVLGQDPTQVSRKFEVWWPELDKALGDVAPPEMSVDLPPASPAEQREEAVDTLEEILAAVRYIRDATPPREPAPALGPVLVETGWGGGSPLPAQVRHQILRAAEKTRVRVFRIHSEDMDDSGEVVEIHLAPGATKKARADLLSELGERLPNYGFRLVLAHAVAGD